MKQWQLILDWLKIDHWTYAAFTITLQNQQWLSFEFLQIPVVHVGSEAWRGNVSTLMHSHLWLWTASSVEQTDTANLASVGLEPFLSVKHLLQVSVVIDSRVWTSFPGCLKSSVQLKLLLGWQRLCGRCVSDPWGFVLILSVVSIVKTKGHDANTEAHLSALVSAFSPPVSCSGKGCRVDWQWVSLGPDTGSYRTVSPG